MHCTVSHKVMGRQQELKGGAVLRRQLEQHKAGLSQAQQDYSEEARRQKALDAQAHKLGGHLDKARAHADQADKTTAMHSDSEPLALLPQ